MTLATVEIAFGIDPYDNTSLDNDVNWTDVTSDVRRGTYKTSTRSSRFAVFSAGTASITLDNRLRVYDPEYAAGAHFGDFQRYTPIRIVGTHSAVEYVQWYGYVLTWRPAHDNSFDSVTIADCGDDLRVLSQHSIDAIDPAAHGQDTAGERIGRVLDDIGHPSAYRDLDEGNQMTDTTFGVNALRHIMDVAVADAGQFYAQPQGPLVTYDNQSSYATSRQLNSQVTLTGGSADPQTVALTRSGVGAGYRDLVRLASSNRVVEDDVVINGSLQEVDNSTANRPPVVYQRTGLPMRTDGMAALTAEFYADLYGTEDPHVNKAAFVYRTHDTAVNTELFVRQLRDRVTVTFDPAGASPDISNEVFIDGIEGRFERGRWTGAWTLSSADAYDDNLAAPPDEWFVLDTDQLGTGRLGY